MPKHPFDRHVERMRKRLKLLVSEFASSSPEQKVLVQQAVEDVSNTVQELQVASEELRLQNEELAATRQSLEDERRRYQELFHFAPDAYIVTDRMGTIREANRAALTLFGAEKQAFVFGKPFSVFVTQQDCEPLRANLLRLRNEDSLEWEMHLPSRSGPPLPVAIHVVAARDPLKNILHLRWLLRDITERKQAEARLERENREIALANRILRVFVEERGDELFHKALQVVLVGMGSRYGVFGYIPQPGHLYCPSLSKMLDQCEVEGKCIHYPPEKWKGLWARALKEKRSLYTNEPPEVPPGHPIIHNNLAVPILFRGEAIGLLNLANKEGGYTEADRELLEAIAGRVAPVLYAWIQQKLREEERKRAEETLKRVNEELEARVQDRTQELQTANQQLRVEMAERVQAEKDLGERTRLMDAFFENSMTPLVFLDKEFNFIRVNPAYAKACRRDVSEFPGHNHFEFYPSPLKGVFEEVVKTKQPWTIQERPFVFPDHPEWGTTYWDLALIPLLDKAGEVEYLIFSLQDVTERKRGQEITHLNEARLTSTLRISQRPTSSIRELLDFALDEAIALSGSKLGYIYYYDEHSRKFTLHAWSKEVMKQCTISPPQTIYELEKTGIWGEAVRQRKPILLNDFTASHSLKKGYPAGHANLFRFLTIPIFAEGRIVAVVGVANKPTDYTDADVSQLTLMMDSIWRIAQRKEAEEQARAAALYARGLIEASLDPLVTINREGKITDVNEAAEMVTGVPREKLIGDDFSDYFTDPEKARTAYQQVFAKGQVRDYPLALRHTSGQVMEVLYNAVVYRNEAGEVQGVFAAARDVTEIKRAETRTRFTNDLLQLFVTKATRKEYLDAVAGLLHHWSGCRCLGIRVMDAQQRIPYESYIGFSKEFWELENWLALKTDHCACVRVVTGTLEPQDLPAITPGGSFCLNNSFDFLKSLTEEQKTRFHGYCIKSGFASIAIVPLRYRDQILGAIHFVDERPGMALPEKVEFIETMTPLIGEAVHRFNVEAQVRQMNEDLERRVELRTAQLQAANQEMESFSYSVSHDLRAPLRAIHGYSGMILDGYSKLLDAEGRRMFDVVRSNAQRMSELIDALLDLSRLGRKELELRPIKMADLAAAVFHEIKAQMPERRLQFDCPGLPAVQGDPTMIRQVFVNLLSNAVKFTRTKEQAVVQVGADEREREIVYFVRDNGVGFDMSYVNKLFGAFQRLHREEEFEGLGIGLSLVQRIIHRHGGRVWAEGKVGAGATFYFTLPSPARA